ncbi:TPA: EscN/YscN/HrcN family type III secretion system ATPase [Morganella morganii]|nr:EscN/YscN/HrcN family type III secretion system ATPase [Morganella morganii]HDF2343667.1 EscN/YscN/HrcN family type III secretion system ATPase [Morganella morganii]
MLAALEKSLTPLRDVPQGYLRTGRLLHVGATLIKAYLPGVFMGEMCCLLPEGGLAEVVGIDGSTAQLSPFASTAGLHYGQQVRSLGRRHRVPVGEDLLGRVLDGMGLPLDDGPAPQGPWRDYDAPPPSALLRRMIDKPMFTGIRAIDGLLTCGEGQRVGIFAAAGVGKSTLMSMLCRSPDSDINVLVLIGERGREVREFIEKTLEEETRRRCVIVVSTSDRPALERMRALSVATTIAEAFRDRGKRVMLFADSLTRYARAAREIALAGGEVAVSGSYPPGVFAALPRLLERAGRSTLGSITAFYTVLVESDDMNEPLADEVRSLLDGHIVLSRRLAEAAHFPAIDILASISRLMTMVAGSEHQMLANAIRTLLSTYRDVELLVRVGEFVRGEDALADLAVDRYSAICHFLQQQSNEPCDRDELLAQMRYLTDT